MSKTKELRMIIDCVKGIVHDELVKAVEWQVDDTSVGELENDEFNESTNYIMKITLEELLDEIKCHYDKKFILWFDFKTK